MFDSYTCGFRNDVQNFKLDWGLLNFVIGFLKFVLKTLEMNNLQSLHIIYIVMQITIIKLHITNYRIWVGFDTHRASYYVKINEVITKSF